MLELAFSLVIMVSCLIATFGFGHTFYVYNQLVTAVGNGARYAATRSYRAAPEQEDEETNRAIANMVVYGDPYPAPAATPAVANLTPEQVEIRWVIDGSGAPIGVGIAIRTYTVNAGFRTFTFNRLPGVEFPYVGKYQPTTEARP
jgi:hypothetical protein